MYQIMPWFKHMVKGKNKDFLLSRLRTLEKLLIFDTAEQIYNNINDSEFLLNGIYAIVESKEFKENYLDDSKLAIIDKSIICKDIPDIYRKYRHILIVQKPIFEDFTRLVGRYHRCKAERPDLDDFITQHPNSPYFHPAGYFKQQNPHADVPDYKYSTIVNMLKIAKDL